MSSEWGKSSGDPFAGEAKQNTCVKAKSATVDAVHGDQLADCEVNEFARTDEREVMNDASELTRSIKDIRVGELNLDADNTEREEDETSSESPVEGSGSSPIPEEMFYPGSLTRMSGMRLSSVSGSSVALAPEDASPLNASQCESMTAVSHMTVHHVAENNNTRDRLTPAMAESQFANFLKLADDPEIISHFVTLDTEDKIFNFLCNIPAIKAFV
ncbi:unnamed protein product [Notodromas monacha]|uniref:Uncharacterized protein n=1 Tax=Notodromas monacha TaxID=399045 RepID=A0A7R9C1M1_9CRUS|nr:unnamed protein product [Notodromas monacha]CAG0924445.1 unnamed protein product [Notodromas monacha]